MDSLTPAELIALEEGICILCGYDDVECLEDCTVHKCIGCGYALTSTDFTIELEEAMEAQTITTDEQGFLMVANTYDANGGSING